MFLVRLLFKHLISLSFANGIFKNCSLCIWSLMVYRSTVVLCILPLYPVTLLKALVNFRCLAVGLLAFSIYLIISSANNGSFIFSFLIFMLCILFFLIALSPPVKCWVKVVRVVTLVSFLILGKAFSNSPIRMMYAEGFWWVFLIRLRKHFLLWFTVIFYHKPVRDFIKCLFPASIIVIIWFFFFFFPLLIW